MKNQEFIILYKGEEIDTATGKEELSYLLSNYRLAYGPEGRHITTKKA